LLLVIDDAWRIEAALAFKAFGPRCAYLMTTRFPPIALQFAPNDAITISELIHTMRGSGYILREAWTIAHDKHTQFLHSSLKLGIFRHKRKVGG
jgi:hypothetical protein